jgi:hypothetical protein
MNVLFMVYFTTLIVVQTVLQRELQGIGSGVRKIEYVPIILWMPVI